MNDPLPRPSSTTYGPSASVGWRPSHGNGAPQNNPVGFVVNEALGTIDISGWNLTASKKFRNLRSNPNVAFVVDDIASIDPWEVRGVEIRGVAEALDGEGAPTAHRAPTGDPGLAPAHHQLERRKRSIGNAGRDVPGPRTAA